VAGFLVLEGTLRSGGGGSEVDASEDNQGSTRRIAIGYLGAAVLAPVLRRIGPTHVLRIAGPLGLVLQAAGLSIRVWSMESLAESYSRTLRVTNEQTVNESGPYRFVRHPGYLGSLLIWAGFSFTSGSVPVVGLVAGLLIPAYRQRILAEESLLRRDLAGYGDYAGRVKMLVPGIW
jgi:protein-S-isoprenylcysteine O-methyltransferase Ste14